MVHAALKERSLSNREAAKKLRARGVSVAAQSLDKITKGRQHRCHAPVLEGLAVLTGVSPRALSTGNLPEHWVAHEGKGFLLGGEILADGVPRLWYDFPGGGVYGIVAVVEQGALRVKAALYQSLNWQEPPVECLHTSGEIGPPPGRASYVLRWTQLVRRIRAAARRDVAAGRMSAQEEDGISLASQHGVRSLLGLACWRALLIHEDEPSVASKDIARFAIAASEALEIALDPWFFGRAEVNTKGLLDVLAFGENSLQGGAVAAYHPWRRPNDMLKERPAAPAKPSRRRRIKRKPAMPKR